MSKYKVLWIDDEWEKMISFKERCELPENDFEMVCTANAEDGMKFFEDHLEEWSAVILDAMAFVDSKLVDFSIKGMQHSIEKINELKSRREVPYYIYTGQPGLMSTPFFAELYEGHYYKKLEDDERLIADIKQNADNLFNTQIIHKHQAVFDCWPERKKELLYILTALETESWQDTSLLNEIRKMMEDVMVKLCQCGYCTKKFTGTNLNECSTMLGKTDVSEIIPVYIQRDIHLCVNVTNEGSHRSKIDSDISNNRSPYLIRSLIYSMLDILYWCRYLPDPKLKEVTAWRIKNAQVKFRSEYRGKRTSES